MEGESFKVTEMHLSQKENNFQIAVVNGVDCSQKVKKDSNWAEMTDLGDLEVVVTLGSNFS